MLDFGSEQPKMCDMWHLILLNGSLQFYCVKYFCIMSWYFGVKNFPCKTYLLWTFLDSATVKQNRKHNARLVWSTSNPSGLLDVVSITNFVAWKISCSVFETSISFRFVVPTFESFVGLFSPCLSAILWASGRTWCEITSRRSRNWLVSSLSPHVPNMVLAKMNNYEHQSKPHMRVTRFKSGLMSFCFCFIMFLKKI